MTTITSDTAPSLTLSAFEAPRGALLPYPLALLELDALPNSHRIDKTIAFAADIDWVAAPYEPFTTAWRPCTPGVPIVVEAVVSCPVATVYVHSSANGTTQLDALATGNLNAYASAGLSFTTTQPFYRVVVAVSAPCRGTVRTQQRG